MKCFLFFALSCAAFAQPAPSPAAICSQPNAPIAICAGTAIAPNVVNLTQATAASAIAAAGLTLGTVTTVASSTVTLGNVVNQSAVGIVTAKSSINLIVSSGPATTTGGLPATLQTTPIATLAQNNPGALYITLDQVNAIVVCVAGYSSPGCPGPTTAVAALQLHAPNPGPMVSTAPATPNFPGPNFAFQMTPPSRNNNCAFWGCGDLPAVTSSLTPPIWLHVANDAGGSSIPQ